MAPRNGKLKKAIDIVDKAVKEVTSSVSGGRDSRVFKNWEAIKKRLTGTGDTR
jgi:hypothetical protein